MNQHPPFRLCGGTFFALFAEARTATGIRKDPLSSKKSGRTESDLFLALASIIFPDLPKRTGQDKQTISNSISNFKTCKTWGWSEARLKESHTREVFSARLHDEYAAAVRSMEEIVQKFIDMGTQKDEWLCKALLVLIEQDDSIPSTQEFYAQPDGTPISKEKLCQQDSLYIAPFLLGVWHFCVCGRKDNACGHETYENWFPQNQSHGRRTFQATFVEESQKKIKVSHELPPLFDDEKQQEQSQQNGSEEDTTSSATQEEVIPPAATFIQNVFNSPFSHPTINVTKPKIFPGDHCVINIYED
ncbi:hypothetical protein [uncultured Selenomonas sp.]|uniref:hypothetical protein n=1 Tax=uncultured Selenomonas sp. TaxID=159275 RepID=UPI0025E3E3B0|nr:hypothetical protein [uncultured Selenomonas sp.]